MVGSRTQLRCFLSLLGGLLLAITSGLSAQAQGFRQIPTQNYNVARLLLLRGDYPRAEREFRGEVRGSIKIGQSRFVDSICYYAMLGEVYFQQGRNEDALEAFSLACRQFLITPEWMLQVNYPDVRPSAALGRATTPWGSTTRNNVLFGETAGTMTINFGSFQGAQQAAQNGGVVQAPQLWPVDVAEVMRCTILAFRRRNEILGPLSILDPISQEVSKQLERGIAPPNHWSIAWADLCQGSAAIGVGKTQPAQASFTKALLLSGRLDHSLTCVAMLELGRISMNANDLDTAARWFMEASFSAYYYEDFDIVQESLVLGTKVHMLSNKKTLYPPLDQAIAWAKRERYRRIEAQLLLMRAENLVHLGQVSAADATLGELSRVIGRNDFAKTRLMAESKYLAAYVDTLMNRSKPAATNLTEALSRGKAIALWNFRIGLCISNLRNELYRPRDAMDLLSILLRDPTPEDWGQDPFEVHAYLNTLHYDAYDAWFAQAIIRKEPEIAIVVADRAKRHRYLNSLPLGGRLASLRTILESDPQKIAGPAVLQRQEILLRYPQYNDLLANSKNMYRELLMLPLNSAENADKQALIQKTQAWDSIGRQREGMLAKIALSRQPSAILFPEVFDAPTIQSKIPDGTALVVFHARRNTIYGFLFTNKDYTFWELGSKAKIMAELRSFFKECGNYDGFRSVDGALLTSDSWKKPSTQLYELVLGGSRLDISNTKSLIVVPDDVLWYLPFEAMIPGKNASNPPLYKHMHLSYSPLVSTAIVKQEPLRKDLRTAIVAGKMFPKQDDEVALGISESLVSAFTNGTLLPSAPNVPARLFADLVDQVIVLPETEADPSNPFLWSPIPEAGKKTQESLAAWTSIPTDGPKILVMPDFRTPAESGFKRVKANAIPGNELFLGLCTLHGRGTQTVLISRWRTGGQTSVDLVREFSKELNHMPPEAAWQRSILLMMDANLMKDREPRVDASGISEEMNGKHPFFWGGYILSSYGITPPKGEE